MLINNPSFLNFWGELFYIFLWLSAIMILVMIFLERSEPRTIAMWIAVLIFVPVIGFLLYLCFGQTFYSRRQFAVKNVTDQEIASYKKEALEEINDQRATDNEEELMFARAMLEVNGVPYSSNNRISLYPDVRSFFEAFLNDLRKANDFIHIEYHGIKKGKLADEFMSILIDKAKKGVEVKLLLDAFGFINGPKKHIREFKKAGGKFALFHRTVTVLLSPKKQNRNHRKIAVIDGDVGYTSGFDIADEYLTCNTGGKNFGVGVYGQSVFTMNTRFFMDWGYATKEQFDVRSPNAERYFPLDENKHYGDDAMQLITGGPDTKSNPIELQYLKLINVAKNTLYIHTPYLMPSNEIQKALIICACSGVDLRIMMPAKPKRPFVYWTSVLYSGELMKHGVRIYRYKDGYAHSKTLVTDGEFCSIGSANLDQRSMRLSFESNAMIYSKDIGKEMNEEFLKDIEDCTEYTLDEFNDLGVWANFKISVVRLFSPIA